MRELPHGLFLFLKYTTVSFRSTDLSPGGPLLTFPSLLWPLTMISHQVSLNRHPFIVSPQDVYYRNHQSFDISNSWRMRRGKRTEMLILKQAKFPEIIFILYDSVDTLRRIWLVLLLLVLTSLQTTRYTYYLLIIREHLLGVIISLCKFKREPACWWSNHLTQGEPSAWGRKKYIRDPKKHTHKNHEHLQALPYCHGRVQFFEQHKRSIVRIQTLKMT